MNSGKTSKVVRFLCYLGFVFLYYLSAVFHHADVVRSCENKGWYNGSIFGEDIKCKKMKIKGDNNEDNI